MKLGPVNQIISEPSQSALEQIGWDKCQSTSLMVPALKHPTFSNATQGQQGKEPQVHKLGESDDKSTEERDLRIKLERSRAAIRTLTKDIGAVIVTSSSDGSEENFSSQSNEVEQVDNEFARDFTYTTNVSFFEKKNHVLLFEV